MPSLFISTTPGGNRTIWQKNLLNSKDLSKPCIFQAQLVHSVHFLVLSIDESKLLNNLQLDWEDYK